MTDHPWQLLSTLPALVVPDVPAAVAHYRDVLGFHVPAEYEGAAEFAIVDLAPGQGLHLKRGEPGTGRLMGAYVRVSRADLARTAAALAHGGANIVWPLTDQRWAMREIGVADNLGHLIRWGAELDPARDRADASPMTCPEIPVEDVPAALAFTTMLGFETIRPGRDVPYFALARRDGVVLHWAKGPYGGGPPARRNRARGGIWDICIEARGVEALALELRERGAAVTRGPVVTEYGVREVEIEGPESLTICFGEDITVSTRE
jgi:catechol 2,3-dioxygenase-like lactoylglutathione lyase family enzyme/predicted enzyme related to lactoylglutathione lyase